MSGYGVGGLVAAVLITAAIVKLSWPSTLDVIPTVGSNNWLASWWAGFKFNFLSNGIEVLQEGYEKYNKAPFKISTIHNWIVILSSREHIEELRRAPDDTVSFMEAADDLLQIKYTMGPGVPQNPYHIPIVRTQLIRAVSTSYPEIRNEIDAAFDDILDLKGNEWKSIVAFTSVQKIVCRTSNKIFVGLPLCRDPDWIDFNLRFIGNIGIAATVIPLFPEFLKPFAARFLTRVAHINERGRKLLGPIIEERQRHLNEYGKQWADKPNDFLSRLMDEAEGMESTIESLTSRVLAVNFAAIHTTSTSFTHALFYLAANPQYIQPLREEVEAIIHEEGWSTAALIKMYKVDSFLKECQRREGSSGISLMRKTLKEFRLSDGTIIPKDTLVAAASRVIHYDEALYPNAHGFSPFRFSDMCQVDEGSIKHQFVSTTPEYLAFGHGRHACPGRFFAATTLKTMLAHVLVMCDIKLEDSATRPEALHLGLGILPHPSAKVMFRRRIH